MPKLQFVILICTIVITGIIVEFGPSWYDAFKVSQKDSKCVERRVKILMEKKLEESGGSIQTRKDLLLEALELQLKYKCD